MPAFRFVAVSPDNQREEGVLEAADAGEAARLLRRTSRTVLRIEPKRRRAVPLWTWLNREVPLRPAVSRRELMVVSREWAGLLEAGLPLHEVLRLSAAGRRRAAAAALVGRIADAVRQGTSLAAALARENAIPPAYAAIAGAGEAAGTLPETMNRLAADLEDGQDFGEQIRGALIYPVFLTVAATGAIVVLLTVVVPNLEALIEPAGRATLPAATRAVLGASHLLRQDGKTIALSVAAAAALLAGGLLSRTGKGVVDRLILHMPVVGPILHAADLARYCRTLAALLAGGVPLARALPLAARAVHNAAFRGSVLRAHDRVLGGVPLADALDTALRLPAEVPALIRTGERGGRLPETLAGAGRMMGRRVRLRLQAIATLIGPALTLGFGLVAGVIVYAMLSTILGINELAFQ